MSVSSIVVNDLHGVVSKLPFYAAQTAEYKLKLADIVRTLNVVSSQPQIDIYRQGITKVNIGSNVSAIGISCFADCKNLTDVSANSHALDSKYPSNLNSFKQVEDYCFISCSALTSVSFLDESNKTNPRGMQILDYIGQEAFANTGLTAAYVPLRRSTGDTFVMPSAFANCQSLKHAENVLFNYLGPYEFANCRNLTSVKMTDYHAYSYECTFKDCVSLKHIDFPAKLWRIGDRMFEGCSSLTSVTFLDSPDNKSELSQVGCYGNYFLSGTNVKSLTFPSCVVDWTPFNDFTLSGMPKLKHIKFNGIPFEKLGEKITTKSVKFDTHHLIMNSDVDKLKYEETITEAPINGDKIKNISQYISLQSTPLEKLINKVKSSGTPFVIIKTNSGCSRCRSFAKNVIYRKRFLNWLKNENDSCVIFYGYIAPDDMYALTNNRFGGTSWPAVYGQGQNSSKWFGSDDYYIHNPSMTADDFIAKIKNICKGYVPPQDNITIVIDMDILTSKVFGLGHAVTLESKEGKTLEVTKKDASGSIYGFEYEQEEIVDRHTGLQNSNTAKFFKFGQWYYNAKQLREVADQYHIPMFVEIGSIGCGPCEEFASLVYQNANFQKFMKKSKILLCRTISYSSGYPGQSGYVYDWVGQHGNPPYNQQGHMPVMFMYWNTLSAMQNGYDNSWSPGKVYEFAWFSTTGQSATKAFPAMNDWNDITAWITNVSNEWQLSTVSQQVKQAGASLTSFNAPSIEHKTDTSLSNWYNVYKFDQDDTYGAHFPVKLFDNDRMQARYTVYLSAGTGSAKYKPFTLTPQSHQIIPVDNSMSGIYQYFTMPVPSEESAMSEFNATYDISGLLFSIGPDIKTQLTGSTDYAYGAKTVAAFRSDYSLNTSHIASQQRSLLFGSVYKYDSRTGDLILPIAVDNSYFDDDLRYNAIYEYEAKDLAYSKVKAYISGDVYSPDDSTVQYTNDDEQHLYVVSAMFYKTSATTDAKLQWLSVFNNGNGYDSTLV